MNELELNAVTSLVAAVRCGETWAEKISHSHSPWQATISCCADQPNMTIADSTPRKKLFQPHQLNAFAARTMGMLG